MSFSSKQIALALVPKFTGFMSMAGSFFIFQHVARSPQRRKLVYHRLLLGMSCSDMIGSFMFFLSTWPIPRGTPGVYGAVGTTQTCTAAGFFNHASALCTPLYNGALAVYYLLVIRFGWKEEKVKKIEKWLHFIPVSAGLGTAVAGLPLLLFNSANWLCWIAPLPPGCKDSHRHGYTTCVRGDNSWIYRWAFLYAEVWFTFLFIALVMALVYWTVLQKEKAIEKYDRSQSTGDRPNRRKNSRKVMNQAMMYVGAFYLTWIFGTLTRLLQLIQGKIYFPIIVLMTIFFPLQGFFNCLVYLRPRYLRYRETHPEFSVGTVLYQGASSVRRRSSLWRPGAVNLGDSNATQGTEESSRRNSQGSVEPRESVERPKGVEATSSVLRENMTPEEEVETILEA